MTRTSLHSLQLICLFPSFIYNSESMQIAQTECKQGKIFSVTSDVSLALLQKEQFGICDMSSIVDSKYSASRWLYVDNRLQIISGSAFCIFGNNLINCFNCFKHKHGRYAVQPRQKGITDK